MSLPRARDSCSSQFSFLRVRFAVEEEGFVEGMSVELFKYVIVKAVQDMYGQVGRAAIDPDVLSFDPRAGTAILAVQATSYRPLWAALTLLGRYDGKCGRFELPGVAPDLVTLAPVAASVG